MNDEPDPSPTDDPLAMPATRGLVLRLAAEGYLDQAARDAALRSLEPSRAWWLWANRLLLAAGSTLVLAGVIFFFAYNWSAIPPLAKLALAQALVAILALAAWRFGLDSAAGRAALVGASIAVGALLAVFGQIYQTGADAYELFVGWAALIAGWTIVSRSAAAWMLWIVVVDVAIGLYWQQVLEPAEAAAWETGMLAIAGVDALALAFSEYASPRAPWIAARGVRWVLWSAVLAFLTIPACAFVGDLSDSFQPEALAALVAALAIGYWHFRRRVKDLFAITLGTLSACALVLTTVANMLQDGKELALLSFGMIVLAVFSGATVWLRAVGAAMAREQRDV
jgi:uncharacterized membrane protein